MSLESALDEERKEILALLEGRPKAPGSATTSNRLRAASPAGVTQSPVRSMLDVGPAPPRHGSIAGIGVGVTSPTSPTSPPTPRIRSMLDPDAPPPPHLPANRANQPSTSYGRSGFSGSKLDPESSYHFEMMPSNDTLALPKRVTQGGKKSKGALSSVFGASGDMRVPNVGPRGRHNSTAGILGKQKSMSPSSRLSPGARSASPGGRMLNTNSLNLMSEPGKYVSESGKVIDMQSAYRRLSDAALLRSGSSLAKMAARKGSDPEKGESLAPDGSVRLEKDYYGDKEEAVESSDEDQGSSGDESGSERRRGRGRTRTKDSDTSGDGSPGLDSNRKPKSLLEAAEQERRTVSTPYQYRSLLDPAPVPITVTGPDGSATSLAMQKKTGVHPNTSFDAGSASASGISTPMHSDEEAEISDIRRAQRLALNVSPIHSTPSAHRCIRYIVRGEYARFQREAEQGLRRQRVYLVATDLSDEAAYALEWTIGTVLRDGDTLLAVYAIDEETRTGGETGGVGIGEGEKAMRETGSLLRVLSQEQEFPVAAADGAGGVREGSLGPSGLRNSVTADEQPDFEAMGKAERERWRAAEEVSERCVKLLRKTRLQVRVVVEVFHCKSPKHMITEVIDFLEPTLVILGSRGRSQLKGVLLGSFSNYLVTKSSVPVMVARKRLRKHSKYKRKNIRLANVLTGPSRGLAAAKVD